MVKDDEKKLLAELQRLSSGGATLDSPYVREVVRNLGINENRAAYICEKWTTRGWYDYGVSVLAGWLTEAGMRAAPF